jgi:hypothetical protein
MRFFAVCLFWLLLVTSAFAAETIILQSPRDLAPGDTLELAFDLAHVQPIALRITLKDADFAGASILASVNGKALPPYHAFGGDTRYDAVRGKPSLHPPIAKIEANHVLIADWVHKTGNKLVVRNAGPGKATIDAIAFQPAGGHDLPRYENPIYFDFDVWRQGSAMRAGVDWKLDTMLLGIIPGGGAHVMNYSGGDGYALKLEAENARINWGFGRSTFYSIWHLANNAGEWAEFLDIDQNKATAGRIHSQFANPPTVPPGTDVALIKPDGYLNALKPGIDALLAYSSDYNFTCEQWGPRGQGFGRWWGDAHASKGYDAKRWADNYQAEFSKLAGYAHQRNPGAPVMAPHWWIPDIRFLLYDTALARGKPMSGMTDVMMTHYYSFPHADFTPAPGSGKPVMEDDPVASPITKPDKQYPGGKFEPPNWEKSRPYMSTWALIPEIAIDWNRYRLSRTEKDLLPGLKPEEHRWNDGRPFDFRAGFDGDERLYNNETCVYDRQYSAPSPYQFLYAMFSYSLLPTGAGEPREFKITRTLPLTPEEPASEDVFGEVDVPINKYGEFVPGVGAAGTHRFRTRDPLYGDLFGYTGFEQATTGDYIWLSGIKERHHRREPHNAWNLTRRTCYAFVTSGSVYPAIVNDEQTNDLIVKTLLFKQGGQDVIGVYAVNFYDAPRKLDLMLPALWKGKVAAQIFDEKAADWAAARNVELTPKDGLIRVDAAIAARGPWLMLIYPPAGEATLALLPVSTPRPLNPWGNGNIATGDVVLRWEPSRTVGKQDGPVTYETELAREMLFRVEDRVELQNGLAGADVKVLAKLEPNRRYHWRVRATTGPGLSTGWSRPASFWYQIGGGASPAAVAGDAPAKEVKAPRVEKVDLSPFTDENNLAHAGTCFSHPNYWEGAGEAVDGFDGSAWVPDATDPNAGRKREFPCWWAVRFDAEQTVSKLSLLWGKDLHAKDFEVQAWDGKAWQTVKAVTGNVEPRGDVALDAPVKTRAVRIRITTPANKSVALAEIYMK